MSEPVAKNPPPLPLAEAPPAVLTGTGLLLFVVVAVSAMLWQHWSGNADLSHGLLMPVVFIYLIHEARSNGVRRYTEATNWRRLAEVLLGAMTLVLGAGASLYAAALGWGQALAAGLAGASLCGLLLLAALSLSDRRLRLLPLNWQAVCAALLWLLTVPMPPGTYSRLSGALQEGISKAVLLALNLLGVAATRQGNIIELAHARVGVEEACSGVRSLIACIFAALLISALVLRAPGRRVLLVLSAPVLALLMNLLRSLALTLLANEGIDINGTWHDSTGFAILGMTALLLFLLAQKLEAGTKIVPKEARSEEREARMKGPGKGLILGPFGPLPLLLGVGACSAALAALMIALQYLPRPATSTKLPVLEEALPRQIEGWQQEGNADLRRFSRILHTEHLLERTYTQNQDRGRIQVTVYAAAWEPGAATPAEISLHTPEVCWPGAGWTQIKDKSPRRGGGKVPHALSFRSPEGELHQVVYWLIYDGEIVPRLDPYSPYDLIRIALRYGYRAPAPQVFVRVSGNRPLEELLQQPPVSQALHALGISGLSPQP